MTVRLGLTGSMATGKSTVLAAFAECGVPTLSADAIVHEIYAGIGPGKSAVPELAKRFPAAHVDGRIDRQRLSQILTSAPHRLAELESVVHPLVREEIASFMQACEVRAEPACVVEVPLLFENGHDYEFDLVLVTVCDPELQRQRILARPGMTVEKLESLLARQMPQHEKKDRADYVFDTSRTIVDTQAEVRAFVAKLRVRENQKR